MSKPPISSVLLGQCSETNSHQCCCDVWRHCRLGQTLGGLAQQLECVKVVHQKPEIVRAPAKHWRCTHVLLRLFKKILRSMTMGLSNTKSRTSLGIILWISCGLLDSTSLRVASVPRANETRETLSGSRNFSHMDLPALHPSKIGIRFVEPPEQLCFGCSVTFCAPPLPPHKQQNCKASTSNLGNNILTADLASRARRTASRDLPRTGEENFATPGNGSSRAHSTRSCCLYTYTRWCVPSCAWAWAFFLTPARSNLVVVSQRFVKCLGLSHALACCRLKPRLAWWTPGESFFFALALALLPSRI